MTNFFEIPEELSLYPVQPGHKHAYIPDLGHIALFQYYSYSLTVFK